MPGQTRQNNTKHYQLVKDLHIYQHPKHQLHKSILS